MELILYKKDFDDFEAKIRGVIESVVSKDKTAIFRSIENMIERIMHLTNNPEIAVLIIKIRKKLLQLYSSLNVLRRADRGFFMEKSGFPRYPSLT